MAISFRYYRLQPTALRVANTSIWQLSEFAILNGTTRLTGMTASGVGTSSPGSEGPAQAADNNTATKFLTTTGIDGYLRYDFGAPVTATGYRWATANDVTDRDMVSWYVDGSNDGSTWVRLDTRTGATVTTARTTFLADFAMTDPSTGDTTAPTTPGSFTATAAGQTAVNLAWTASTDNVGVAGYTITRNGTAITTTATGTSYADTGLSAGTAYSYTIRARDAAGNLSPTASASATTIAAGTPGTISLVATYGPGTITTGTLTAQVTTAVGDVLVVVAGTGLASHTVNTPTGGTGLTWTLRQSSLGPAGQAFSQSNAYLWTATATTAETFTLTVTGTAPDADGYTFSCMRFTGVGGFGGSAASVLTGAPAQTITTTGTNSAVVVYDCDFNATDGTTRTWRTTAGAFTEAAYLRSDGVITHYLGAHLNVGAPGAKTVGMTAPSGQQATMLSLELVPTVAGGGGIPALPGQVSSAVFETTPGGTLVYKYEVQTSTDGALTAAQKRAWVYVPSTLASATTAKLMLACHGDGQDGRFVEDTGTTMRSLLRLLMDAGYVVIAPDYEMTGANLNAQARTPRAYSWATSKWTSAGNFLFGFSMGGAVAAIAYHRNTWPNAKAMNLVSGEIALLDVATKNAGEGSYLMDAWGVTNLTDFATVTADYDPVRQPVTKWAGKRLRLMTSPDDVFPFRQESLDFIAAITGVAAQAIDVQTSGPHGNSTQFTNPDQIVAFYNAAALTRVTDRWTGTVLVRQRIDRWNGTITVQQVSAT